MADPTGGPILGGESSMVTNISDVKIPDLGSAASNLDFDDVRSAAATVAKANPNRLFGREQPVHMVLGGGKFADIILWRNRKMSAMTFGGATFVWYLFEVTEYHFVTLMCHMALLCLVVLFVWTKASSFINRAPPRIPEIQVPDACVLGVVWAVTAEMNHALDQLRDTVSGKNLKRLLSVMGGLWFLSVLGGWFDFLTLIYFIIFLMFSAPALYEKYEDQVDPKAQKALGELHKHYEVLDKKVLSKLPSGKFKDKKQ